MCVKLSAARARVVLGNMRRGAVGATRRDEPDRVVIVVAVRNWHLAKPRRKDCHR